MVRAADTAATCGGADRLTHRKSIHVKRHAAVGASVSPAECDAGSAEQELVRDADHGVGVRLPHIDHPSVGAAAYDAFGIASGTRCAS